jgi:hypothetical protein
MLVNEEFKNCIKVSFSKPKELTSFYDVFQARTKVNKLGVREVN